MLLLFVVLDQADGATVSPRGTPAAQRRLRMGFSFPGPAAEGFILGLVSNSGNRPHDDLAKIHSPEKGFGERRALDAAAAAAGLKPSAYVRRRLGLEIGDAGDVDQKHLVDVPSPTSASPASTPIVHPVAGSARASTSRWTPSRPPRTLSTGNGSEGGDCADGLAHVGLSAIQAVRIGRISALAFIMNSSWTVPPNTPLAPRRPAGNRPSEDVPVQQKQSPTP